MPAPAPARQLPPAGRRRRYLAWYVRGLYEGGASIGELAARFGLEWSEVAGLLALVGTPRRDDERPPLRLVR